MNRIRKILAFSFLALPFIGAITLDLTGMAMGIALVLVLEWLLACVIFLPVNSAGVVRNRVTRAVTGVRGPGFNLIIWPLYELWSEISTLPETLEGTIDKLRSADGVPLQVHWWVIYQLTPFNIAANRTTHYLPMLVSNRQGVIQLLIESTFRMIMGCCQARTLCSGYDALQLTRKVRTQLQQVVWPYGFIINHVVIGEITAPEAYQGSLIKATNRLVDTEAQKEAFRTSLQEMTMLSEEERDWLLNREQLWVMQNIDVSAVYVDPNVPPGRRNHHP